MQTISISEVQRNLHKLDDFDVVKIVDRKRNRVKGYYLDAKFGDTVEKFAHRHNSDVAKQLKTLRELSKNVTVLEDKSIDLTKIDSDMNDDIF
jgi:DNA-binding transcriptional regulator GbsR (MarR family)